MHSLPCLQVCHSSLVKEVAQAVQLAAHNIVPTCGHVEIIDRDHILLQVYRQPSQHLTYCDLLSMFLHWLCKLSQMC